VVNVSAPDVRVQAAEIPAPIVNVQVAAPIVNVAPAEVLIDNRVEVPQRTIRATPQRDGSVIMVPQE
jgi:hypothetical protein